MDKYPYQVAEANKHLMKTVERRREIIKAFARTINEHSLENDSNTPDFILAEYLFDCLVSAHLLVSKRSIWYNPNNEK